jgi:predicted glutamine amidotransferase
VPQIAKHGTFNMLLSNGQALWAHASTKPGSQGLYYTQRAHPFTSAQLIDQDLSINFAEHASPDDKVAVVVSQPLTRNEVWTAMQPGELGAFVGGQYLRSA